MRPAVRLTKTIASAFLPALALAPGALAQSMPSWRPGVQLYTVREALAADRDGTLKRVAEIGYREVELAGLAGATVREMQASLGRHGLDVPSMHVGYDRLRDDLDAAVAEARTLGARFVVCPSADARTIEAWKGVCRTLGRAGRICATTGSRSPITIMISSSSRWPAARRPSG